MGKQDDEREDDDDASDEFKRNVLLVTGIVIALSFLYGFGKPGGSGDTVIPG